MTPRLLVGNLDAEHRIAGESVTRAALATASALATLMRVFAREGDRLWTPVPVDPRRVPDVPGLPRPELVSGEWEELEPAPEVLAWAEVPGLAALRSSTAKQTRSAPPPLPLHELLWRIRPPDPEVVRRVLHRGFHLRVARELGMALPGARRVRSVEELERHLEEGGARASPTGGWVAKAPWSAAGRSRVVEPVSVGKSSSFPGAVLRPAARRRVERLLARHGELIFEPWMDRVADFGCTGVVTGGSEVEEVARRVCHRLRVDSTGRFQGIELAGSAEARHESRPLQGIARRVALALNDAGYRGPFGIDAYLHRDREAREVLHPLGEINARLTFGHVARALAERLAPGRSVRLTVGRYPPSEDRGPISLLLPGREESPGAWFSTL